MLSGRNLGRCLFAVWGGGVCEHIVEDLEGRNPDHNLCPVGKAVSRTFLTALRPWPKADAENQPSELGCERCAMLAGGASRGRRNEDHNSNHILRSEAHLTPE